MRWLRIAFQEGLVHSWWVLLFATLMFAGYESAARALDHKAKQLETSLARLKSELEEEQENHELLQRQLASQKDPAFIELTLIRKLGVVPKGQRKVCFEKREAP